MKILLTLAAAFILAGCITVEVTGVTSDGCAWTKPLYLTEASIAALRSAQEVDPDVRIDREAIVTHNRLWQENCDNTDEK